MVVGKGPNYGVDGSFYSPKISFSINFSEVNTKCWLNLHYNVHNSYLFINGEVIFKFKYDNKNFNFPTQFYLESISNRFSATETREVSSNRNVYDFSVDCSSDNTSDMLNIHKYLMIKII